MQNSHRGSAIDELTLPEEWAGLNWPRWQGYRVVLPGEGGWPLGRTGEWGWTGGVFWPSGDVEVYDPIPQAAEAFDDALRVDPGSVEACLGFIQRWGTLSVGTGLSREDLRLAANPQARAVADTLWATRRAFREVQRHFAWFRALRERQWRSDAVPGLGDDVVNLLDAARQAVVAPPEHASLSEEMVLPLGGRGAPYLAAFTRGHLLVSSVRHHMRPRDRERGYWQAFGASLTRHLQSVHPAIRWVADRPTAAWRIPRLVDLLWVQLWNLAAAGVPIRQCRHCRRWFPVDHRGKLYCTRTCTNRASAKASYEARKTTSTRRPRR